MAKILKFEGNKENLLKYIDDLRKMLEEDKIDNIMIACKDKNNKEMYTGYFNLDIGEKMEMVGHVQADIMDDMIRQNIDQYIEYVEE